MFKNLNPSPLGISGHQSEIIELALTFGFRGIDFSIADFATRVKLQGMASARRLIDSAKLRLGTFSLPFSLDIDEDAYKAEIGRLPEYAQVAREMECTRCLYTIAPASDKRPYHENFELHRRRFADICKALEPSGLRLGVRFRAAESLRKGQPFQFIHDFDALSLLLNMVGAPNLGLNVDVWDLHLAGGSVESIRSLPVQQIVALQLADMPADLAPAEMTEQARLLPGASGRIDSVAYLTALAEMGYDGPVIAMPDRKALDAGRRDRIVRQAADALDRVWKAAGLTPEGKLSTPAGR